MKVLIKNPKEKARVEEVEDLSLKKLQGIVDGYIELITIPPIEGEDNTITCFGNEEAKLIGMKSNFSLWYDDDGSVDVYDVVCGPVIFCGTNDDGESIGLTDEQITVIEKYLNNRYSRPLF